MREVMLKVDELVEMSGNENVMTPEEQTRLVAFIREVGFKQPLLVRRDTGGRYEIVDGKHRKDAAVTLGMTEVPCELDEGITTEEEAKAVRLGMNRNRGALDLSSVGRTMLDLSLAGWSPEDLTIVGFSDEEVQALLESAAGGPDPDEVTATVSMTAVPSGNSEEKHKTYKMVVEFENEGEWKRCKKALSEVGDGDLAAGLVKLLEDA